MPKYRSAFILIALVLMGSAHAAGLCASNEATVFTCELKETHKIVSLCSSKDLSDKKGFLQYRYGVANKVELTFPQSQQNSQVRFGYDEYSRPDLSTFVVGFNNGDYRYEISETTEGGDDGLTVRTLLVSSEINKRGVKLTCFDNRNTLSSISTLDRVLACDKKHVIVEGACD